MAKTNLGKVSLTPRRGYNPSTPYVRLDVVEYEGSSYIILKPCQGVVPTGDNVTSMLMAGRGMDFKYADFTSEQLALLKGEKGDKGDTGEQGEKGNTGAKGDKGDKGDTGDQGIQGEKGDKGDQGIQGEKGDKGDKGDKGEKGDGLDYSTMTPEERANITGKSAFDVAVENGFDGTEAEWLVSLKGAKGDKGDAGEKGDKGDQGVQGEQGLKGDKGDKGDTGAQGVKGDTGSTGAKGEKGDTGAAGSDGEDGKDFEVPTLSVAPGENTLTYSSGGASVAFRIGQLARFFDSERGESGEYVFYQLYDIANNKAVWKLSGSGGDFTLPGETLIVTLDTNQTNAAQELIGAVVKLTHSGEELDLIWQGQPITVEIPFGLDYRVSAQDVALFAAPAPQQFMSNVGYTRSLTLTYLAEKVSITATTSDGKGNPGASTVTVIDEDTSQVRYQGAVGTGIQIFVPYGSRYRVSCGGIAYYATPSDQIFTAENPSRVIPIVYAPVTRLVFNKAASDPSNITGAGEGAIVDILAKMRRCLVKKTAEGEVAIAYLNDANSVQYADGSTAVLTGNEGDVMVYKPAFYYKYEAIDANRFAYQIAEIGGDGWIFSPASLIGAYKSYSTGSKLYSRSGVAPSFSISQANNIVYAKARGTGYNIIDFEQHCMIALLFYAKYGNRNSQAVLGTGNASYSSTNTTGSTNSRGNSDTQNASSGGYVNFAGIEGVHGGCYEWVAGVEITDYVWKATDPDGTQRTIGTAPSTSGQYITEIAAANGEHFDIMPIAVGGSISTYYSDNYDCSAGSRVFARSFYGMNERGGVTCAYAHYDSAVASASFASRLAFRGVIREAESVAAFKALPLM